MPIVSQWMLTPNPNKGEVISMIYSDHIYIIYIYIYIVKTGYIYIYTYIYTHLPHHFLKDSLPRPLSGIHFPSLSGEDRTTSIDFMTQDYVYPKARGFWGNTNERSGISHDGFHGMMG